MKNTIGCVLLLSGFFAISPSALSQQPGAYQLPDSYHFDYEVVQQVTGDNNGSGGPKTIEYYYSGSGDYMAMKAADKNNNLMIFTKDGTSVIIDDQKKTIMIFNIHAMMGDMGKVAAQYNKNNPSASSSRHDSTNAQVAKTGKTKDISGYTAEEYSFTNNKGEKASIWYVRVEFNAGLFYLFGSGGSASPRPGMNKTMPNPAYPQLSDPHMLVAETENNTHPGVRMTTQSIAKKTMTITTKSYAVTNLSNMGR
ncbi:MAG TPA: hypothetical protein VKR53_16115 [Puia sp.]|nr:hypothetical protein [Puia sp.]